MVSRVFFLQNKLKESKNKLKESKDKLKENEAKFIIIVHKIMASISIILINDTIENLFNEC